MNNNRYSYYIEVWEKYELLLNLYQETVSHCYMATWEGDLPSQVRRFEQFLIERALDVGKTQENAAILLGISPRTLQRKLKKMRKGERL